MGRAGPMGYGGGAVIAAGIMAGAALVFAAGGISQLVFADDGSGSHRHVAATDVRGPGDGSALMEDPPGEVPAEMSDVLKREDTPARDGEGEVPGLDPDAHEATAPAPEPGAEQTVYVIQPGDTLTAISDTTGIPIGQLVEVNAIENPNLIRAGASLLIPPG